MYNFTFCDYKKMSIQTSDHIYFHIDIFYAVRTISSKSFKILSCLHLSLLSRKVGVLCKFDQIPAKIVKTLFCSFLTCLWMVFRDYWFYDIVLSILLRCINAVISLSKSQKSVFLKISWDPWKNEIYFNVFLASILLTCSRDRYN